MISKNQIGFIQSLHLKKYRDTYQLFIAEGIKTVLELVNTVPQVINEVFAEKDFLNANTELINSKKIKITLVSDSDLKRISLQTSPNKVLAVCHYFDYEQTLIDFNKHFTLFLDDIRDPGNFGTIIRLANWYGISQIFASPNSCDFYNPKVIQSTMGAFIRVKCNYVELSELTRRAVIPKIYGAVLSGKPIYTEKLETGLIVIGNEANGIQSKNLSFINNPITIPAAAQNGTESLNAAIATGIIVSEFYRQLNFKNQL